MGYHDAHLPCDDCGSSDALQKNENGSSYCHSCGVYSKPTNGEFVIEVPYNAEAEAAPMEHDRELALLDKLLTNGRYNAIPSRGLTTKTAQTYGILDTPEKTYFSYYSAENPNTPIAAKVRQADKRFTTMGDWKEAGLFGQNLFNGGGKYITICEGEYDAAAAYQMQGSKYPCVSIRNGAQSALKDCKAAYEYLDSFKAIIVCFDSDEAGLKASREVAELFGGKSAVMKHPVQ
tara:strand:+ start:147 stop:845 length:699 start_codon:yes stop_codon:yes gene_type:complete